MRYECLLGSGKHRRRHRGILQDDLEVMGYADEDVMYVIKDANFVIIVSLFFSHAEPMPRNLHVLRK